MVSGCPGIITTTNDETPNLGSWEDGQTARTCCGTSQRGLPWSALPQKKALRFAPRHERLKHSTFELTRALEPSVRLSGSCLTIRRGNSFTADRVVTSALRHATCKETTAETHLG